MGPEVECASSRDHILLPPVALNVHIGGVSV
jgi:hypothetical protein